MLDTSISILLMADVLDNLWICYYAVITKVHNRTSIEVRMKAMFSNYKQEVGCAIDVVFF